MIWCLVFGEQPTMFQRNSFFHVHLGTGHYTALQMDAAESTKMLVPIIQTIWHHIIVTWISNVIHSETVFTLLHVTCCACIWQVTTLNLSQKTVYSDSCGFIHFLFAYAQIIPSGSSSDAHIYCDNIAFYSKTNKKLPWTSNRAWLSKELSLVSVQQLMLFILQHICGTQYCRLCSVNAHLVVMQLWVGLYIL